MSRLYAALLGIALVSSPAMASERHYISNPSGVRQGYLVTTEDRVTAYDRSGRKLGHYDRRSNKTYNSRGVVIARGNYAAGLIEVRK
jgi:hypothetical protein